MNLTNYGDNHSRSDWLAAWGIADGRCWPFIIFARNWEHHLKTQAISGILVVKRVDPRPPPVGTVDLGFTAAEPTEFGRVHRIALASGI